MVKIQLIKTGKISLKLKLTQSKTSFNHLALKRGLLKSLEVIEKFLSSKEIKLNRSVELSLTLCGKAKIKTLNGEFRHKSKITDVLSFPIHENLRNRPMNLDLPFHTLELGDIFICTEVAKSQAKEFGITQDREILHLFIHGFLHLLGFDHEINKKEEDIMFSLEEKLMKKIVS